MTRVEEIWWRRDEAGWGRLLAPAEWAYRAAAGLRGALYGAGVLAAARAAVPVISVGNLAVGGSGKTPAVLALARRLQARRRAVAVLSRGYGAVRTDERVVADGSRVLLGADEAGDEPLLLARRLPGLRVLCGPRRADLARRAVAALGADALLLDDGFQHRALARDLDVVVLDAENPWGNGRLLPRGPNREGRGALSRAGLLWLSRADRAGAEGLGRLRELALRHTGRPPVESRVAATDVVDAALSRSLGRQAMAGRRALLLAAVARPESVRLTAAELGAEIAAVRFFRDHHRFTEGEVEEALAAARAAGCQLVVTTEKDAVRLPGRFARDERIAAVRIEAEISRGEEELEAALDRVLARWPPPGGEGRA